MIIKLWEETKVHTGSLAIGRKTTAIKDHVGENYRFAINAEVF